MLKGVKHEHESSDSEYDSDSEIELLQIQYKGTNYYLEHERLYEINSDNSKGNIFGNYINGKIKKINKHESIEV